MKAFQYITIADRLEELINNGTYQIGEKLPSLRSVHQQYNASIGTVLKAFILLIDKGLIEGKERSSYIVLRKSTSTSSLPQNIKNSQEANEVTITQSLKKVINPNSTNKDNVSFFGAVLDTNLLPFNAIRRSLQLASRDLTGMHLQYEQAVGNVLLRQEIAKRSFKWNGKITADDVIITNGALEAVNLCLRAVTKMGDTIMVEMPIYFGVLQTIESLDLKVVELTSDTESGVSIEQMELVCSTQKIAACVLMSNFSNPGGVMLADEKKQAIAVFANRMKVPIIDDDIYGDLHYGTIRPSNIKTYDTEGWVMLCSSFSKSLAPGLRIGWCAPGRFKNDVLNLKAVTNIATASIVQLSMLTLLSTGAYDRHLRKLRPELHRLVLLTIKAIEECFPKGTRISRPQGGLVLWIELDSSIDTVVFQKAAWQQNIDVAPGSLFSNTGEYTNYIRISCSTVWSEKVEKALKKLGNIAHHYSGKVNI
ncbi:putative HTH-type transcriptional regulator YjiR [compost metagenome]